MASIEEIRKTRLQKLELLKKAGMNPYPAKVPRDMCLKDGKASFESYSKKNKTISLSGRIMAIRGQGAILFVVLDDGKGKLQAVFKKDTLDEKLFKLFSDAVDIGDFISITGTFFKTERGEESLLVNSWTMAAKSLLPLPEKWHGLQDTEEKLRKRYLDVLFNPEVKDLIKKKTIFWQSVRNFLISKDFLEIETPVLETTTGGADARPFKTHHNALDIDVFLRISAGELWQKELMIAGFNKTFEIGRIFRNEGMSAEHLQDYTQMEFYWSYADYTDGMELVEELYKFVAQETFGTLQFKIGDHDIDLGKKWERYDYTETIRKIAGIDIQKATISELEKKLGELKVKYDRKGWSKVRAIDVLWKYCRRQITGPGFLVGVPKEISPLAKTDPMNPNVTERFQPIIAGSELGNGYSELNDPIDQAERFEVQTKLKEAGDEEAQMYAHDFVEALEYGMPPTCGFGMSERVFAFLADKSVRETQIFPLLKPKQ